MGKCKFNQAWMEKHLFRHWLKPVVDVFEAYCTVCKKRIQLGSMGVKALDSCQIDQAHEVCPRKGTNSFHHHRVPTS